MKNANVVYYLTSLRLRKIYSGGSFQNHSLGDIFQLVFNVSFRFSKPILKMAMMIYIYIFIATDTRSFYPLAFETTGPSITLDLNSTAILIP